MPFGPAKSGRESRSKNCVIFLALLTMSAAFLVSGSYLVWSASFAVGMAPGDSTKNWVCVDPFDRYSMKAFAWPRSLLRVRSEERRVGKEGRAGGGRSDGV